MLLLLGILLGLAPGFVWLFFYLQEDPHPEPKSLLALTFFFGCAFAFFALPVQVVANQQLRDFAIPRASIISVFILAFTEEVAKFGAAYLALFRSRDFDEPIDAMIYMVVAALGFATVENLGAISSQPITAATISGVLETASLRFVGATLLHALCAGIIGYHWAYHMRRFLGSWSFFWALILATSLHSAFNFAIIKYGDPFFSVLFVIVAGFFVLHDFEKLKKLELVEPEIQANGV